MPDIAKRELCVLTAVRVPPSICRAQQTCSIHVSPFEIFIFEFPAIDACHASAIAIGDVSALHHKLVDYAVEW